MTHASLRAQLGYAVLEGVSFGINDGLQALKESGTPIAQCSLVGGGARSPFWAQLLADILAMPVVTHKGGETGGALGAARLACWRRANRLPRCVKNRKSGRLACGSCSPPHPDATLRAV